MRFFVSAAFLVSGIIVSAQEPSQISRDLIEQRIETVFEQIGDETEIDLTNLFDLLNNYLQSPLSITPANLSELASLQLLSDVQITALSKHLNRYGPLLSLYELQVVDGFDRATIDMIRPFVTVGGQKDRDRTSLKEMLANGTSELLVRSITTIEERKGYYYRDNLFGKDYTDPDGDPLPDYEDDDILDSLQSNGKVYLGSPYKFYTRYRFKYRNNISFGITAEKDEGEEFFRGSQPDGFDFYSAHLFLRDIGPLKNLALGDYQAQFGQGLTFWSGLGFASKSSYTMNVKRNARGLSPYASVNENQFLRGIAATYAWKDLEFTGFYSKKKLDANLNSDPIDNLEPDALIITSFQQDGLHRRPIELVKKDAIDERIFGGNLKYAKNSFSAGVTAVHVDFGAELQRNTQAYNQFEFQGRENTTVGADFSWVHRNMNAFGEIARSARGGLGYLAGILLAPDRIVSISVLHRHYDRDFHGLYSIGFAEGSRPWNEQGTYFGLEIKPKREWSVNAYYDQFDFPWLRFQTDAPSAGSEWLVQVTHRPSRKVELYARVRKQDKARNAVNIDEGIDPLIRVQQTNYRLNVSYKVSKSVTLRTRMEGIDFNREDRSLDHGFLIYQDFIHRPLGSPLQLTFRMALFDTESYDARIYAYESELVGVYSILPYYGRGMRWYGMAKLKIKRRADLWVRYGSFIYNDRDRISSSLQEISGNRRSDIKVQLRLKF
jgi:hypothetical protein